ncbi:MAG: segregation/condensation protein A [Coriobacteriia bacterium]|nr:segregation/condensation protein A [Coriobacteriia bacterium]
MSFRVRIESFEGPFDLLLYLVSRQKVDIGAVNITEIANQYLYEIQRMENLDLDVASDFLLVASTLLKIKAESLIPQDSGQLALDLEADLEELTPGQARDMLVERLLTYKQFKNAAAMLDGLDVAQQRLHARTCGPEETFMGLMPDYLANVELASLTRLAAEAFARRDIALLDSEHIAAKPIPVEVHVRSIHQRISAEKHLRFSQLVDRDAQPALVVVNFLAILELYKRAMVTLRQKETFGDIDIHYIEGSGELVLEGDE